MIKIRVLLEWEYILRGELRQSSIHCHLITEFLFQHPWAVAIMKNQGTELHCSGSIISSRFILSAAHCMKFVDVSNLELVLGASNLKDPANSKKGVIKKGIKGYKTHEKNVNGVDYDIAIIEVAEEITFDVSTFFIVIRYVVFRWLLDSHQMIIR